MVTAQCVHWSSGQCRQPTTKWSRDYAVKAKFLVLSHMLSRENGELHLYGLVLYDSRVPAVTKGEGRE